MILIINNGYTSVSCCLSWQEGGRGFPCSIIWWICEAKLCTQVNLTIHTVCHICILMHHLKGASFLYILKRCLFVLFTIWMQNKILAVMMETIKFFTFSFVCSLLQEIATRWVFELEAISLVWRCLQAMTICSSPKLWLSLHANVLNHSYMNIGWTPNAEWREYTQPF